MRIWSAVADEQPESARLEVSESSTSLTGESHSDTTYADASVLDPTFTSCLGRYYMRLPSPSQKGATHDHCHQHHPERPVACRRRPRHLR
jgi:hypothetical protein